MLTLAGYYRYEEEIKKSRFIAHAASVSTPEETFAFMDEVGDPQATHNCWVFKIGTNYRFSEDGEPKGTVGKPMLGAIERLKLDHVMVVVTRYFGGIKLGTGGLTRAYGGVTAQCLQEASKKEVVPMAAVRFEVAFERIGSVYNLMKQHGVEKLDEEYTTRGIQIDASLEESKLEEFRKGMNDITRGDVTWLE